MSIEKKIKKFNFYSYVFPNKTSQLKKYLLEENINYKIREDQIFFEFDNEYCKRPIMACATFENDNVTRLQLKCYPISFNNKKAIEVYLDSQYNLVEKDYNAIRRIYEADGYTIVANNPDSILIDVQFEQIIFVEKKENKKKFKKILIFTILGLCLSSLFITLYFIYKSNVVLNILTAITAIVYALFQFVFIYIKKSLIQRKYKIALCVIIPFIYFLLMCILLLFLFVQTGIILDFNTVLNLVDILFVIIYLSPSFHLLLLLLAGLQYV